MKQDSVQCATHGRNHSKTWKLTRGDQTQSAIHFLSKLVT